MKLYARRTTWMCCGIVMGLTVPVWGQAETQPAANAPDAIASKAGSDQRAESGVLPNRSVLPARRSPGEQVGVVIGNNVYVRSGSDRNYYPVTKLNRGDRVIVVGEAYGWLKIVPPAGTYSLIDKTYVNVAEGRKTGTVNEDRTWVFAGSHIDKRKHAKQVKLDQGTQVKVLGETEDGAFVKIEPPKGAHVWIIGDYVDLKAGSSAAGSPTPDSIEVVKPGELPKAGSAKPTGKEGGPLGSAVTLPSASKGGLATVGTFQIQINAIEAEITAESAKPLINQMFEPIIAKLHPLAEQTEDETARIYATARIGQLQGHVELVAALREMRELRENAISAAGKHQRERAMIMAKEPALLDDIVVRGEVQVSGIYTGKASRPKRWRIVSPDPNNRRTLAYLEVPEGSPINPVQYYGKYVGIRASARKLMTGTIPPVPVYTVEEIKVLDPAERTKTNRLPRVNTQRMSASPSAETVEAPSSQPAANTPAGSDNETPATAEPPANAEQP